MRGIDFLRWLALFSRYGAVESNFGAENCLLRLFLSRPVIDLAKSSHIKLEAAPYLMNRDVGERSNRLGNREGARILIITSIDAKLCRMRVKRPSSASRGSC